MSNRVEQYRAVNPYERETTNEVAEGATNAAAVAAQQALKRIEGQIIMAKKFPRDKAAAYNSAMEECEILELAEAAAYEYTRGGSKILGPSIRLAEVLARSWGNMESGFEVIALTTEKAEVRVYAWDLETNAQQVVNFSVPLIRETRNGKMLLTSERDIYEHIANQAARRRRTCVLGMIPAHLVTAAMDQCARTLSTSSQGDTSQEAIANMVKIFHDEFGVTRQQIEKKIGYSVEAIKSPTMVRLRRIFQALRDNITSVDQEFQVVPDANGEIPKPAGKPGLADKIKQNAKPKPDPQDDGEPDPGTEETSKPTRRRTKAKAKSKAKPETASTPKSDPKERAALAVVAYKERIAEATDAAALTKIDEELSEEKNIDGPMVLKLMASVHDRISALENKPQQEPLV